MGKDRDRRGGGSSRNIIALPVQRRAPTGEVLLSAARARRAAAVNAALIAERGLTPADLDIDAAPHTIAFSQAVARLQAQHGLPVDGIVGPETAAALADSAVADDPDDRY